MRGGGRAILRSVGGGTAQPGSVGGDLVGRVLGDVGMIMEVTRADVDGNRCIGRMAGIVMGVAMLAWLLGMGLLMPRRRG